MCLPWTGGTWAQRNGGKLVRQAHSYFAGAISSTVLIAAAVIAFVLLVSAQAFREWPVSGLGWRGGTVSVSPGRAVGGAAASHPRVAATARTGGAIAGGTAGARPGHPGRSGSRAASAAAVPARRRRAVARVAFRRGRQLLPLEPFADSRAGWRVGIAGNRWWRGRWRWRRREQRRQYQRRPHEHHREHGLPGQRNTWRCARATPASPKSPKAHQRRRRPHLDGRPRGRRNGWRGRRLAPPHR